MTVEELKTAYLESLQKWFLAGDEHALSSAYEIGRQALGLGLGILDLTTLHRDALQHLKPDPVPVSMVLSELLLELLSPFEMTLTGYQQTNQQLQRLNQQLLLQKDQLEIANRDLEAFSYSVSHDLRGPARRVRSFSDLLASRTPEQLAREAPKYIEAISRNAQQMEEMIEALLELAKWSKEHLKVVLLDLSLMAKDVFQECCANSSCRLILEENLAAQGDRVLLRVVLQNLISNAVKFSSKEPDPEVEFGKQNGVFFVKDNGAGFNPRYADRLFSPFQRLHHGSEFEGTGVGLATVQRILERHGGKIWAGSDLGMGATFFFTLPEAT